MYAFDQSSSRPSRPELNRSRHQSRLEATWSAPKTRPPAASVTPLSADRIYQLVQDGKTHAPLLLPADGEKGPLKRDRRSGPRGRRPRRAEKAVKLCARTWDVVRRLYPDLFNHELFNPWRGVALSRRTKLVKSAATRQEVYIFAETAIAAGHPEVGAAAVICFEWLQRPENVLAGYIRWTDYRGRDAPSAIRITHHKTGAVVLHPLEDADGTHFYADAEAVLREGTAAAASPSSCTMLAPRPRKSAALYSASGMAKLVQRLRQVAKLSQTLTSDACHHGGFQNAKLTDDQGRALSAHTSKAYEGYAERTMMRALAATRKRHAHRLATASANVTGTEFRNG